MACLGEMQRVAPAIPGIVAALDEPPPLELVHQRDETARQDAEALAQRALALPGARADEPQDPGVVRRQLQGREPLGEARRRVCTHLCEEESERAHAMLCAARSSSGAPSRSSCLHAQKIVDTYRSYNKRFMSNTA